MSPFRRTHGLSDLNIWNDWNCSNFWNNSFA